MKRFALFVLLVLSGSACQDDGVNHGPVLAPGTYYGTFYRWPAFTQEPQLAKVHLVLRDGAFSGASNVAKYPAICHGKYSVSGMHVEFMDSCFWTADFDWGLILKGKFEISIEGDYFRLSRKTADYLDVYMLKRNSIQ